MGALAGEGGRLGALLSVPLGAAAVFALSIALTGALHVDGFLDTADAVFAPVPAARRLEILKDPRRGSFAIAAFAVAAALWLAALATLPAARYPAAVALAAGCARFGAVANALVFPYGRPASRPPAFARRPSPAILALAVLALTACSFAAGPWAWTLVVASPAAGLAAGAWLARRFGGGLVGDHYGFAIVALEVAALCALGALRG